MGAAFDQIRGCLVSPKAVKSSRALPLLLLLSFASATGCGYTLRHSDVPLLAKAGVRRIYVKPVENSTFKPGIEQQIYNSLIRVLSSQTNLHLVSSAADADATLLTSVTDASYSISVTATANTIPPVGTGSNERLVPTEYRADLACEFNLQKINKKKPTPKGPTMEPLWGGRFSRSQNFPANTQLGTLGTTTALINESEFDRALTNLAEQVGRDASESLLSTF